MGLLDKIKEAIFGPTQTEPEAESPCPVCNDVNCEYDYDAEVEKIRAECVTNDVPDEPVADCSTSEDSTRTRAYQLWERDKNAGLSDRGDWYYWFQAKSSV